MTRVDLLIAGGGCAGLSLGTALAKAEKQGRQIPKTVILESRTEYVNDRTWCFWFRHTDPLDERIRYRWPRWQYSRQGEPGIVHEPAGWSYACVPSIRFYEDAQSWIESSSRVELIPSAPIESEIMVEGQYRINTPAGIWEAPQLIETRPPEGTAASAPLIQSFYGAEVESAGFSSPDDTVGLMENMSVDEAGFRFEYVLPLAPQRRLIEVTRFSPGALPDGLLEEELNSTVRRRSRGAEVTIQRTESGAIPMGLPESPKPRLDGRVYAGTPGGAVRASSGYAYRRIQTWAAACAESLISDGTALGHDPEPKGRKWMDDLFLSVLKHQPERTPDLFMTLAKHIKPESLVRFLSDEAGFREALSMITSLPATPFLLQLIRNTLHSGKQAA